MIPTSTPDLTGSRKAHVAIITEHVVKDLRVRALLRDPAYAQDVIFQTVADCLYGSRAIPESQS